MLNGCDTETLPPCPKSGCDTDTLTPCPTSISPHTFTAMGVYFNVLKMKQSFILWIGREEANISTISTALSLPGKQLASSKLMGPQDWTTNIAQKLAAKTKHQVFVFSDDLEPDEFPMCEKIVFQKLQANPEIFLTS